MSGPGGLFVSALIAVLVLFIGTAVTLAAYDLASWLHYVWTERPRDRPAPHYPIGRHRR